MFSPMRRFRLLVFLLLLALIVVLPIVFMFVILEKTPAVYETKAAQVEYAFRTRALVKRSMKSMLSPGDSVSIVASEDDLNGLMAFLARGIDRLDGHVRIASTGLEATLALHIPHNPIGDYINLRINLHPSESGLGMTRVWVGRIPLSDPLVRLILRFIIDLALGHGQGKALLESIQSVSVHEKIVTVHFRPLPDLKERFKNLRARLKGIRDRVTPLGDPATVRVYYAKLIALEKKNGLSRPVSLARFMAPLFQLAKVRSTSGRPVEENRAALLALAIYAGDWRFERLVGPVRTAEMRSNHLLTRNLVLGGRRDLRLHFVISAGLK